MNGAVAMFNTYSDYAGDIPVIYNSGVPTAQTDGYMGWIEFGGSISYRVAMHEMSHWLGTGTAGGWSSYSVNGNWIGAYGNSAIQSYDGPTAVIGCDTQHYWPYGWNYDNEAVYPERHIGMVGAMRRDMGLSDNTIGYAPGTYSLRNRSSVKLLDNDGSVTEGSQVKQYSSSGSANQQWILSLIPGTTYFTLSSLGDGKFLDSLNNTNDGAAIVLMAGNSITSQQWRVVQTDAGFYQIINRATGKCLDTGGQTTDGTGMQSWFSSSSWNQQWKFVNITPATIPAGLISQFRPVTASSSSGGLLPESAVDGTTLTPWTANGGGYPQWWRVDLGSMHNLTNIITYWYPGWSFQYRIEVSSNDVNYTVAVDATGNAVVGTTTNTFSAAARYVRITTTGITPSGGWASFLDCQIYGTPQIPAAPAGLVATPASSRQINLSWTDKAGVASYSVKRSTTNGGPYTIVASGVKGTSYSDSGLTGSTPYYYVVSAVNGTGESSNSAQATATTPAPTLPLAPSSLTAMPGNNQVVLNWNSSAEAASYNVKRATVSGGSYTTINSPTATTYTDPTAVNGTTYYYAISATNTVGESVNSPQIVATPTAIFAHWKFDETNGTTAVDSIASRIGTLAAGATWGAGKFGNSISLGGTSYVTLPAGLVSSLSGNFSIASWVYMNANGMWARVFDFGSSTTVYMYLAPASGGNTIRYGITTSSSAGEQTINGPVLSPGAWHHVAVTLSGNTGTLYVDGAAVGTNSSMTLKPSSLGSTTQNYIGKSQWPDPYLNGRVDDFRIYSRALTNAEIIALSNPEGVPPSAPTGLTATSGHNQIGLNWTPVLGAISYTVKRATVSGGPYSTIASPTTFSYTDATAINGITYYYVVAVVSAVGQGVNSFEVSATPSELLAYLKFNETSGTNAADSSGNGNNRTLATGATWAAGKINNAVLLNGSSGYVSLPAGVVSTLNDFSVSTWVYVNANSTWARLFDFGTGTTTYMFLAPASGGNTVRYAITTGSGEQPINSPAVLSPSAWHHVAVTLSGTTGTLYVDGAAVGTNSSMTLKPSNLGNTTLNYIGKSQFPDPYLNGRVDDFRIYRRALSASEISTLFTSNGGVPAAPASVTATPSSGQVTLSWNTSASATSYKMKRATVSGGPYTTITNVTTTACSDAGLINGTRYYYVVSAANISGESVNSAQASATPSSTATVNVSMSASSSALNLSCPGDHLGWRLQVQTNGLTVGLGTNWFDVIGSTTTNIMLLPMDMNNGSVFYRLIYP